MGFVLSLACSSPDFNEVTKWFLGWKGLYNEEETCENLNVEMKAIEDQTPMEELQHNVNLILDINKEKKAQ